MGFGEKSVFFFLQIYIQLNRIPKFPSSGFEANFFWGYIVY